MQRYLISWLIFGHLIMPGAICQSPDLPGFQDSVYAVLLPALAASEVTDVTLRWKVVDGVVFLQGALWYPALAPAPQEKWSEYRDEYVQPGSGTGPICWPDLNIRARHLYLSGCLNSVDISSPLWGGGDGYRNFFFGDTAGTFSISYRSGITDVIPLVYGYTAWWHQNYQAACEPFRSDPASKKQLNEALCVINGLDGYRHKPADYYLKILLRDEPVTRMEFHDRPDRIGHYRVDGLTFGSPAGAKALDRETWLVKKGLPVSRSKLDSIQGWTIDSSDPYPEQRRRAVRSLVRKYYTTMDDICDQTIRETPPEVRPEDFPGPEITFSGTPVAGLLTRIYYENANQILGRIDANGMVHESAERADNHQGFGGWIPALGAFYDDSYTRIRALTVLTHMGFPQKVNAAISFFDRWMMYFPESYPEVQLGGKPVPGHATVIANKPHVYYNVLRDVGWRTRYTSPDFGNPENDGHGLLMITRWRAWVKQGRKKQWVDERWEAIEEAAEYIPWCLDHPELSFSRHGLLHNESEGGMMGQSMYCDYICYLGLLGYAQMAEVSGRPEKAGRWRDQAGRLLSAIDAYYPANIDPWGDVWDPEKNAIFSYVHSTLAPACIGMDYYGYDVVRSLSRDWAARTRRTYLMQLSRNRPAFAAPAGMGYGQCYITQTGLLLDEMSDADKMVEWMARLCFTPRLKHPYRVPEGAVIAADGKTWRRWGDLGNLYQMADVVHTIHLMAGIDDVDPDRLTLMPRLPASIRKMEIGDWPVRILSGNESVLAHIDLQMESDPDAGKISFRLSSSHDIDHARLRLGPIPSDADTLKVLQNGREITFARMSSGDADWAWIRLEGRPGRKYDFTLLY
jgi:hypothetical protein